MSATITPLRRMGRRAAESSPEGPCNFAAVPSRAAGLRLSGLELSALIAICSRRNRRTGRAYPGVDWIADAIGTTRTNVPRLTAKLERLGLIRKHRLRGTKIVYEIVYDEHDDEAVLRRELEREREQLQARIDDLNRRLGDDDAVVCDARPPANGAVAANDHDDAQPQVIKFDDSDSSPVMTPVIRVMTYQR